MMALRQLLSIVILPFTVTVLIPRWLMREPIAAALGSVTGSPSGAALSFLGAVVILTGIPLFAWSLSRFAKDGKGTLAPWDPPRKFVVSGPYRYVRNPMISGVVLILFGEAALFQQASLLWWALIFLAANCIQIPLMEEPMLRARFGEPYSEYCRHVRRLVPRLTAWSPTER